LSAYGLETNLSKFDLLIWLITAANAFWIFCCCSRCLSKLLNFI